MAPEQILGHELSPATDLFAFGVVLYEMLCSVLPFVSDRGLDATSLRRLSQRAAPPSQLRPEVGPGLDRLVLRCLMDKPEDRWASAEQTLAVLEEVAATGRPSAIYPKLRSCATHAGDESAVDEAPFAQGSSKA
jgi:serine/threonine protein kinase